MILNNEIERFIASGDKNRWLISPVMKVYVRKGKRFSAERLFNVLDIANIEVKQDEQGKGHFTDFLERYMLLAQKHGFDAIFVENVLTPRFTDFFIKRGWKSDNLEVASFLWIFADH